MIRTTVRLASPNQNVSVPLIQLARIVLWTVALTASVKPADIFGPGEQSWTAPPASDFAFRCLVLAGCMFAAGVALFCGKIRRASLSFIPFLIWAVTVTVIRQADLSSAKQLGSYASWILFYIAAAALFDRKGDFRRLASVMVLSVFLSALGGELQHWLGYAPGLGSRWPDAPDVEFMRTHTGGGGILLDAFTPYCAAFLVLSTAGTSWRRNAGAWILVLWGTANILRGGILAFALGLCWYLWRASSATRRRVLPFLISALICGTLLFGGTVADKIFGGQGTINTSGRLREWPELVKWISDEPLLGHGPDADMDLLAKSAGGHDLRASHNELLSTGVNYGLIGVVFLWVPLILLLIRNMARSTERFEIEEQPCGATAVLVMIIVLSFTDNTLRSPGVMILALGPSALTRVGRARRTSPTMVRSEMESPLPDPT